MRIFDKLFGKKKTGETGETLPKAAAAYNTAENALAYYFETYEFVAETEMTPLRRSTAAILLKKRDVEEILDFCRKARVSIERGDDRQDIIRLFSKFERQEI